MSSESEKRRERSENKSEHSFEDVREWWKDVGFREGVIEEARSGRGQAARKSTTAWSYLETKLEVI